MMDYMGYLTCKQSSSEEQTFNKMFAVFAVLNGIPLVG